MSDIFISYAKEDRHRAQMIAAALETLGWPVFWDRTIPTGETWRSFIGEKLKQARCIVVLWSSASIGSDWVNEEADDGKSRAILIPVLIETVQPPLGFRSVQTADLLTWDGANEAPAFQKLVEDIARMIGPPPSEVQSATTNVEVVIATGTETKQAKAKAKHSATPKLRTSHILWGLGAVTMAVVVGGLFLWRFASESTEPVSRESSDLASTTKARASSKAPPPEINDESGETQKCLFGCPVGGAASNVTIATPIYVLSWNRRTKFSDWAAYRVNDKYFGRSKPRNWKADPQVYGYGLGPPDYKGAHNTFQYDRGHLVPLSSFSAQSSWGDVNLLSNIIPQKSALNQGPWAILERHVRAIAQEPDIGDIYVLAGPLYEKNMPPLPYARKKHVVPSGFWKIVAIVRQRNIETGAFAFNQNVDRADDICRNLVTIRELEKRTGFVFFPEMQDHPELGIKGGLGTLPQRLNCGSE